MTAKQNSGKRKPPAGRDTRRGLNVKRQAKAKTLRAKQKQAKANGETWSARQRELKLPPTKQPPQPDPAQGVEMLRAMGLMRRVADALGITRAAVYGWRNVPSTRVMDVARISGLTPQQLRPDVFRP